MHLHSNSRGPCNGTNPVCASHLRPVELRSTVIPHPVTRTGNRKLFKLTALIDALLVHKEMLAGDLADVLGCSMPAVKMYIRELQDITLIEIARYIECRRPGHRRPVYRATANQHRLVEFFSLAPLDRTFSKSIDCDRENQKRKPKACAGVSPINMHNVKDSSSDAGQVKPIKNCRDPLVAALFGQIERS